MAWCLTKIEADKFKKALKEGAIDPFSLSQMESLKRREFLSKFVGEENAQNVNALFESKLLLKNQQRGMITWAKKVSGITQPAKRDLISRIERLEKVLDPDEAEQFLNDLASKRLGAEVTQEEAKAIVDLSRKASKAKEKMRDDFTFATKDQEIAYGTAVVELNNLIADLKIEARKLTFKQFVAQPTKAITELAGQSKAINASLDNSAVFRQGWKILFSNPKIWATNTKKTFVDIAKSFGNENVKDALAADIVSRRNNLNGNYKKMKLAVGITEEAFPSTLPERLPLIGKPFKASEAAFTNFVQKSRADLADKYLEIAERSGVDITDAKELRDIGKLVNSLTGRGSLGGLEPKADLLNSVFFAPRNFKSHLDFLLINPFTTRRTSFVRKQSAVALMKTVLGSSAILALAKAFNPDSVEEDPRSADFGKIRVGNSRFDVTGGMSSIMILTSRIATGSKKSSITGEVKPLGQGFADTTRQDLVYDFFENKLSPVARVVSDLLEGQAFGGEPITIKGTAINLFVPLPLKNYMESTNDPDAANALLILIADGLGIATNTYNAKSNWQNSKSKELTRFRESVGEKEFKKANDEFNKRYNSWLKTTLKDADYQSLSQDNRLKLMSNAKEALKKKVLKEYKFVYKREKVKIDGREKKIIKRLSP